MVSVLQLQEIEPPQELVAALSADFLCRLGISNPPPVRISLPHEDAAWAGYCSGTEYSEKGEIVLADWRQHRGWLVLQRIQEIYVHETAHRLLSQAHEIESHGVEFFTLLLFLFRRAGQKKGGWPWLLTADLYDCQDCLKAQGIDGVASLGETIDWALELAIDLADQKEITAEEAAAEIYRRAKVWMKWKAEEPNRRAAAQAKKEEAQAAIIEAEGKIFWWRIYFGAVSLLAFVFLGISISLR